MTEFLGPGNILLTAIALLGGMAVAAFAVWLLKRRWRLPKEKLWQLLVTYGGGLLLGATLGVLFMVLASFLLNGASPWVLGATLIGMLLGAGLIAVLPVSAQSLGEFVAYGCGSILLGGFILGSCTLLAGGVVLGPTLGPTPCPSEPAAHGAPGDCPTATRVRSETETTIQVDQATGTVTPTATATPTPTTPVPGPTSTATSAAPAATATHTSAPPETVAAPAEPAGPVGLLEPANFDIVLFFTASDCGFDDFQAPFNFDIQNGILTITQLDAGNITSGPYDPATGAGNTSGTIGEGVEAYNVLITSDGTNITVAGINSFTGPGMPQDTCSSSVFGQTPVQ